jgi:hypothetical protein
MTEILKLGSNNDEAASADVTLPNLIYILIKAKPKRMYSNIKYYLIYFFYIFYVNFVIFVYLIVLLISFKINTKSFLSRFISIALCKFKVRLNF